MVSAKQRRRGDSRYESDPKARAAPRWQRGHVASETAHHALDPIHLCVAARDLLVL